MVRVREAAPRLAQTSTRGDGTYSVAAPKGSCPHRPPQTSQQRRAGFPPSDALAFLVSLRSRHWATRLPWAPAPGSLAQRLVPTKTSLAGSVLPPPPPAPPSTRTGLCSSAPPQPLLAHPAPPSSVRAGATLLTLRGPSGSSGLACVAASLELSWAARPPTGGRAGQKRGKERGLPQLTGKDSLGGSTLLLSVPTLSEAPQPPPAPSYPGAQASAVPRLRLLLL